MYSRVMNVKILEIYNAQSHKIQTIIFQKPNDTVGWIAVNFDRDKHMPFTLDESISNIKASLLKQNFTWEWKDTSWLF